MVVWVLGEIEDFVEIAELREAITWGRRWAEGFPVGGVIVFCGRLGVKLVVDAGEGGQAKTALDELQDRTMLIELTRDVTTLRPGGDDKGGHTEPQAVGVDLRRGNVVEEAAALVIGKEEGRAAPEFRGHEVFDYFCHLVLTRLNIGRWMLTDERLGDQKRDLRQFASGQVCLVIVFVEVESGIMLPVFEMDEHVEIFRRGTCANTEVVTFPGDFMRIQQIHHDWPIEAAPVHSVGRIATGGSRHE
ncbi:MAG: hypothetical protein AUI01_09365 [Ktedonobacter sp. 13_2_20CM_2_56_8]|nr:MAG: hypothetical protein AUI01_09365 [Ktedonobacter sp. 13_2_20CM_2_56_8]